MDFAQAIFSFCLVLLGFASYWSARNRAEMRKEHMAFQYDPELHVAGWWSSTRGSHKVFGDIEKLDGDLFFSNPGGTPITLMLFELLDADQGGEFSAMAHDPVGPSLPLRVPHIIPGLSHVRATVEIRAPRCSGFAVKYVTVAGKGGFKRKEVRVNQGLNPRTSSPTSVRRG